MQMWGHPLWRLCFCRKKTHWLGGGAHPIALRTQYAIKVVFLRLTKVSYHVRLYLDSLSTYFNPVLDMSDFEEVFVLTSVVLQFPRKFLYCTCFSSPTLIPTRQKSFDIWNLPVENRLTFNLFGFAVRPLLNFTINPLLLRCLANLHVKTFISAP